MHRRDALRASKIMQERVLNHPKIEPVWDSELVDVLGQDAVSGVRVRNVNTKKEHDIPTGGVFYAIGHQPNTALFVGQLELDPVGYIVTKPGTTETSVAGVFASGDVQDKKYRQAITAAGTGCAAAIECERWLAHEGVGG